MSFTNIFGSGKRDQDIAHSLYLALVEQARSPQFYSHLAVPDSLDGRFDMIVMHMFLVVHRLKACGKRGKSISQALIDLMFRDMDRSLRELGVGDHGIGRRIKQMLGAFYGRVRAYETALADGDDDLSDALKRNVYRNAVRHERDPQQLAAYLRCQLETLDLQAADELLAGQIRFDTIALNDLTNYR